MLTFDQILFGLALAIGALLVLGAALGLAGLDLDIDAELDGEGDGLGVLGLGRVPLVIVAMILTLSFGATGLSITPLLAALLGERAASVLGVLLASGVSLATTRALTRLLARWMPSLESYASTKPELVGQGGSVLVVSRAGEAIVRVVDRGGAELRLVCDVIGEPVGTGDAIAVVAYEPARDRFVIEKLTAP